MSQITAKMVGDLRAKTGAGLMDCKRALVDSDGNEEQAVDFLRKKGIASAAKKADRSASDGLVEAYIHMGGDECYKGYWERDASVQAFMKKMNLKNGEELQSYFNKRVNKILNDKKKTPLQKNLILENLKREKALYSMSIGLNESYSTTDKDVLNVLKAFSTISPSK